VGGGSLNFNLLKRYLKFILKFFFFFFFFFFVCVCEKERGNQPREEELLAASLQTQMRMRIQNTGSSTWLGSRMGKVTPRYSRSDFASNADSGSMHRVSITDYGLGALYCSTRVLRGPSCSLCPSGTL
jgi:hypothetical protein